MERNRSHVSENQKRHRARFTSAKRIDWSQVGDGWLEDVKVGSAEWDHLAEVLSRHKRDRERRDLAKELGDEFLIVYARYRRQAQRRAGKRPTFHEDSMTAEQRRVCEVVVTNCLTNDIHPIQFLEYWDGRIGDFTDLQYPTLNFLKGMKAIEDAAAHDFKKTKKKNVKAIRNSYADIDGLDPNLRRELTRAGFETQDHPDSHLLTIQHWAFQIAKGRKFFMPRGKSKEMAQWAADNLYTEE